MKGATALSTFGITTVVIGIVVGMGLRTGAQNLDQSVAPDEPTEANFPVTGILKGDTARLHVVNLSSTTGEFHRFSIMFIDARGVLIKPEEACDVRPGEFCSVNLTTRECDVSRHVRCEFRALVVPDTMPCTEGTSGDMKWSANLEVVGKAGDAESIAGPHAVMTLSSAICNGGGTDGGGSFDGGGADGGGADGGGADGGGGSFDGSGLFSSGVKLKKPGTASK